MNKFTRFGKRSWVYILCSVFILASSLVFAIIPSMITLIIYHVVKTSAEIVIATSMDIVRNRNLKEAGFYNDIAEHQCVTESIFQFSRIFSYGSLILISLLHNFVLFQIIFVIFNIISFAVLAIMMCKFEKKYWAEPVNLQIENKQDEEK